MRTIHILAFVFFASVCVAQVPDSLNQTDTQGLKQGVWKKTYPNGAVRYRGAFANDIPVGVFRYFGENGVLKATVTHTGDGVHAATTIFDESGKLQATGFYVNQKKDSLWTIFDQLGRTVALERYADGDAHGRGFKHHSAP